MRQAVKEHPEIAVTNIDKLGLGSNPENLKDLQQTASYIFVKGDISDSKFISKHIKEADAIVNFAAETHVDRSIADPSPFTKSNIIGVFTLLEAIRKNNDSVVYVQISTDEIYGDVVKAPTPKRIGLFPQIRIPRRKLVRTCFVWRTTEPTD